MVFQHTHLSLRDSRPALSRVKCFLPLRTLLLQAYRVFYRLNSFTATRPKTDESFCIVCCLAVICLAGRELQRCRLCQWSKDKTDIRNIMALFSNVDILPSKWETGHSRKSLNFRLSRETWFDRHTRERLEYLVIAGND